MRLTVRLLGLDLLDLTLSTEDDAGEDESEPDPAAPSGGTLYASPVGFVASFDRPDEIGLPDRDY